MGYNMLKIEPSSDRVAQPSFNPHCSKELAPCARAALVAQGKSLEGTAIPAGASRNRVLNSSDAPESERTAVKVSDLGDAGSKFTTELSATSSDLGCCNQAGIAVEDIDYQGITDKVLNPEIVASAPEVKWINLLQIDSFIPPFLAILLKHCGSDRKSFKAITKQILDEQKDLGVLTPGWGQCVLLFLASGKY